MSHFTVYVFTTPDGRSVDELLAPYDENLPTAPYIEYTRQGAIDIVRHEIKAYENGLYAKFLEDPEAYKKVYPNPDHIKYLEEDFPKRLKWTDEECYQDKRCMYDDDYVDEEGNLYSTYNPNAKWDWYDEVGGRWQNCLVTKAGTQTNEDLVSEIDWDKTPVPFAVVDPIGRWIERGKMGWWAIVTDEMDKDKWKQQFRDFLSRLGDDITVTVVDCHI